MTVPAPGAEHQLNALVKTGPALQPTCQGPQPQGRPFSPPRCQAPSRSPPGLEPVPLPDSLFLPALELLQPLLLHLGLSPSACSRSSWTTLDDTASPLLSLSPGAPHQSGRLAGHFSLRGPRTAASLASPGHLLVSSPKKKLRTPSMGWVTISLGQCPPHGRVNNRNG